MKSINYALRAAYVTALDGLIIDALPVPTYYLEAPETETSQAYILLTSINNSNASTFSSSDTDTSMQVQIHTWSEDGNSGKLADDIANEIYNRISPTPQFVLDLSAAGLQMVSLKMNSDNVRDLAGYGNRSFVTRIINFEHNIFHK